MCMVDLEDVRRIALSLPHVDEEDSKAHFRVGGTGFAWPSPERVHPNKARVPRFDIFVIRVAGEDDKQAMLAAEPDKFFTTDHYIVYPAVMARLEAIDVDELTELLTDAHAAALRVKRGPKRSSRRAG
jgi:hypothetical protein